MARIKPTRKQKNLAKLAIENPLMEKKDLVALGGYSASVQKTPSKALESRGFKESLAEYGLTESLVATALTNDIEAKPGKRVQELNLAADILNMKKDKPSDSNKTVVAVQVIINGENNFEDKTNGEAVVSS